MISKVLDSVVNSFDKFITTNKNYLFLTVDNKVSINTLYYNDYDGIIIKLIDTDNLIHSCSIETSTFSIFFNDNTKIILIPYKEIVDEDTHFQYSTLHDLRLITVQDFEKIRKIRKYFQNIF